MDKNQPSPFSDPKAAEIGRRFLELFIDVLDQDNASASQKRLMNQAVQELGELRNIETEEKIVSIDEFLGSIHEKWPNDKRVKSIIEKDIAEIKDAEYVQSFLEFVVDLSKLNVKAGLIEGETWSREVFDRFSQFVYGSYTFGLIEATQGLFMKSELPEVIEPMVGFLGYARDLVKEFGKELGLESDEEIEKYLESVADKWMYARRYCHSKGFKTGLIIRANQEYIAQINHIEKIIPYLKKYERKIRELKKVFNRYPGIFGSKQKWEKKVFVIAQELAEISNHLPDKDRPGDKDNFWACLYKINEYSESILSNWSHYLNDPSVVGVFQSMEQTRRYMGKIADYSDKLEMAIDKLENSVKSQD